MAKKPKNAGAIKQSAPVKEAKPAVKLSTPEVEKAMGSCPNVPSFDYDPKTMEPNLADGESILPKAEATRKDVFICVTTAGRKIFCCSIPDYGKKFGALKPSKAVFEHHYPHAKG